MELWELLLDGTAKAAARIVREKALDLDADELSAALRHTVHAAIDEIHDEWVEWGKSGLSTSWFRKALNAQASRLAVRALQNAGVLGADRPDCFPA
jgi:hypothetical protein